MTSMGRRSFLRLSGAAGAATVLGSCSTSPESGTGEGGTDSSAGVIRWWDQFKPQAELEKEIFAEFERDGGLPVEYTTYNPNEQGQALQLAQSSKQMPDVFTLAGVNVPPSRLVKEGWFTPLVLDDDVLSGLPQGALLEGFSVFDGEVYAIPIRTARQYVTLTWFNTDLVAAAGVDPDRDLVSWDGFREGARKIQDSGDGLFGWIAPLQHTARLATQATELAMAAGSPGVQDAGGLVDPRTGEFAYADDTFADAVEFLLSMHRDGLMFPGSTSADARKARARWATGTIGLFMDGPFNIGVVVQDFAAFADLMGVTSIPTPNGEAAQLHMAPPAGGQSFWLSAQSDVADQASALIGEFASEDAYVRLAGAMDGMPLDLSAVDRADVHPTYKKAAELFRREAFLAPNAIVANPAVAAVVGEMQQVQPGIGEIVQGLFSGDLSDHRAALKQYNDALSAERDRAIEAAAAQGAKASVDDWVHDGWKPGEDYAG